jgi:segregation and condensation protein A
VTDSTPVYTVELDNFSGPLDLLLKLIERQKLDICDISLASVTKDYLAYMQTAELDPHQANWFLVIASKLILVKSRALLPSSQTEVFGQEEDDDLAEQLKLLSQFKSLAVRFSQSTSDPFVARQNQKSPVLMSSYDNLTSKNISAAFKQLMDQPKAEQNQVFKLKRSSNTLLRSELIEKLQQLQSLQLSNIDSIATTNQEKISLFMIILELIKAHDAELRVSENNQSIEMLR